MSKELSAINTQAVTGNFTQKELDTLKSTIAKGTTNEQFALFVQTCVAANLNPFLGQIFCTVFNSQQHGPQMTIQIAVEGIVALAKRNPLYKGFIASEVKQNDEFSADPVTGKVEHKVISMFNRGATVGAYCVAYRDGAPDMLVIVTTEQVEHFKKSSIGAQAKMWQTYFDDMIVKFTIKRAFKRQFGIEISEDGYGQESGNNVDNIPDYRQDITPTPPETPVQPQKRQQQRNTQEATIEPVGEPQAVDPAKEKAAKNMLVKNFELLGIEKKDRAAYIQSKLQLADGVTPSFEHILTLNKLMEEEITGAFMPEELE